MPKKVTEKKTAVKPKAPAAKKPVATVVTKKPIAKLVKPSKKAATSVPLETKAAPKLKAEQKAPEKAVTPKPTPRNTAKSELVKKYRGSAKDTGSVSVQVALLTDRIVALSKHLAKHIHDSDSKRGLLIAVGKRRRLLNYVRENDPKTYAKLIKDLKLKK
mgnify:CR=1 FL=1